MRKNSSLPLLATIVYMIVDILYMMNTSHRSFWINVFKDSILGAVFICVVIFALVYVMHSKVSMLSLVYAIPLTIITYIGGLRGVPLFSLQGVVYVWLAILVFSSIVDAFFHAGNY